MALIAMAVYDTEENQKSECTKTTLECLRNCVREKDRIYVIDNASCEKTKEIIQDTVGDIATIISLPENIGTARAINLAWKEKQPGEFCVKMDNDVLIDDYDWIEKLEYVFKIMPEAGIVGLKRKDCIERPERTDGYKSELKYANKHGEPWVVVEIVNHVMGTCQMYNPELLDKIGFLYQPSLYGYDDALAAVRCRLAGYVSVFYPTIEIHHIDNGQTPYQKWKENHASEQWAEVKKIISEYANGTRPLYENFD